MNPPKDLRDIFRDWEYDEDDNVRFITGDDGREIMQIRQPLGIEQYDLDGRPDGLSPEGCRDFLDYYLRSEARAEETPFRLDSLAFRRLQNEGFLYYQRYLALFQVGQYDRVAQDTRHNLNICELLERCYPGKERYEMLQYQPYIRRINAISRAMLMLADEDAALALKELKKGREEIESLAPVPTPIFEFEKIRSLQHLIQVIQQVKEDLAGATVDRETDHVGFKALLAEQLGSALENEDYEQAARLRDRMNRLE